MSAFNFYILHIDDHCLRKVALQCLMFVISLSIHFEKQTKFAKNY